MNVAAGTLIATTIGYQSYKVIRKHVKSTVNCWFCNKDTRVDYKHRDSFTCPHCTQYNGFNESGDYNRRVPGQHSPLANKLNDRFCQPVNRGPDVLPKGNGLCADCNIKQGTIMRMISNFDPVLEDRWEEELDEYKYKLNKIYPLCAPCSLHAHAKLENDKIQYGYLLRIKDRIPASVANACHDVVNLAKRVVRRQRRQFFSGGKTTEFAHSSTLVCSILLFIAHLDYLQQDADVSLLPLPATLQLAVPFVIHVGMKISLMALILHLIAFASNKCRATLPDLLFPLIAAIHSSSYLVSEEHYREDLAVCRCAFAAFMTVLATAVTFVPRKRLHRKRPNRIISSAFSVASTPASQCSSRNASSLLDGDEWDKENNGSPIRNRMQWRERQQSPEPLAEEKLTPTTLKPAVDDDMDWEPSVVGMSVARQSTIGSSIRPSERARMMAGREATPSRELAPSLSGLSLDKESSIRTRTPFVNTLPLRPMQPPSSAASVVSSRHGFPAFSYDVDHTPTPRLGSRSGSAMMTSVSLQQRISTAPSISGMTSVSRRYPQQNRASALSDTPPLPDPSVFTSVSQQVTPMSPLGKMLLIMLVASSLLGNIALFYVIFQKK